MLGCLPHVYKPWYEKTGTSSSSSHSAGDNATFIPWRSKCAGLPCKGVCAHIKLPCNTGLKLVSQYSWAAQCSGFRLSSFPRSNGSTKSSTRSKSQCDALSLAEKIQLHNGFWSVVIQHNIVINVNRISTVWDSGEHSQAAKGDIEARFLLAGGASNAARWPWWQHKISAATKSVTFKAVSMGQNKDWHWSTWLLLLALSSLRIQDLVSNKTDLVLKMVWIAVWTFLAPPEKEKYH